MFVTVTSVMMLLNKSLAISLFSYSYLTVKSLSVRVFSTFLPVSSFATTVTGSLYSPASVSALLIETSSGTVT